MFDLKGKTALVTGSSQGIGKEVAKALTEMGAIVYTHGSKESDKLKDAMKYIGTDKMAICDLFNEKCEDILYSQTGDIDILILNASIQKKKKWNEFTKEDFDNHINCNLKSSYFIIQKYVKYMKEKNWGRIITMGSVNQYNNHPELLLYGMTKAAQYKMVKNIAPYIAPYGVTINNIAPGAIETPRNDKALSDTVFKEKVINSIPMGYIGSPKDINGAVLLLVSEAGRYITGTEIVVDGGMFL